MPENIHRHIKQQQKGHVMEYLNFTVEGSFITNLSREKLFINRDLAGAIRLLRSSLISDKISPDEQLMVCLQVLNGDADITGNTADGTYGVEYREDIDENPTQLSAITQMVSDMADEIRRLKEENHDLLQKFGFIAGHLENWALTDVNADYYNEYDEPLFADMEIPEWKKKENQDEKANDMLESFLSQRRLEDAAEEDGRKPVCHYGWLEPDGTWHPVEWGNHSGWAREYLNEHYSFKDHPKLYWYTDDNGVRHHIVNGDVLIYSLGWILMDNPYQGLARMTKDPRREMTKEQKDFLFDYYMERGREEEANRLFED